MIGTIKNSPAGNAIIIESNGGTATNTETASNTEPAMNSLHAALNHTTKHLDTPQLRSTPNRKFFPSATLLLLPLTLVLIAPSTVADHVVTLDGKLLETEGEWTIEDSALVWTDDENVEHRLSLDDVDLEASREMTAYYKGKEYVPPPPGSAQETLARGGNQFVDLDDRPAIILYETTWCGYCRKARRLLKQLDADFEAKNVERDRGAAREARTKAGGGGVPVLDFAGVIVRGYDDRTIRRMVKDLRQEGLLPPKAK